MLAARSKLLWFESKFRPMLYLPPAQQNCPYFCKRTYPVAKRWAGPACGPDAPKFADQ
jgi:hypothetical protein